MIPKNPLIMLMNIDRVSNGEFEQMKNKGLNIEHGFFGLPYRNQNSGPLELIWDNYSSIPINLSEADIVVIDL